MSTAMTDNGICARCGGQLGIGCEGTATADCDLNLELARDGVSPDHYRNRVPEPEAEAGR